MFGRKAAKAVDTAVNSAAAAIHIVGEKAGKKGIRAAEAINSAVLNREYHECTDADCPPCKARR